MGKSMLEAIKKVQIEKKIQDTIDFSSTKVDSARLTVVKVENEHANQVVVKRDLFDTFPRGGFFESRITEKQ